MKYRSVEKYLNKNKKSGGVKHFFYKLMSKVLCLVILFLLILIVLNYDKNNSKVIYNYLSSHNINFASINDVVHKYFGDFLPNASNKDKEVFNEKLAYSEKEKYNDGVKLTVSSNYLVPVLDSGIVVFTGDKDLYGKTVIIQQANGVLVWYGNLSTLNVNMYDYISKGEFLGEVNETTLYLVFQKDNNYLDYEEYLS